MSGPDDDDPDDAEVENGDSADIDDGDEDLSPQAHKRKRKRKRKITISAKSLTRDRLREGWREVGGELTNNDESFQEQRPRTWGECQATNARPCPWIACKYHLYLDVVPETGSIIINFPDLEPWDLVHTCALDVARRGGLRLEDVGEVMNLTRERVRQIEVRALTRKMHPRLVGRGFQNDD